MARDKAKRAAYMRKLRAENPEYRARQNAATRNHRADPEVKSRIAAAQRAYRAANQELIKERERKWRANPEVKKRKAAYQNAYRNSHPDVALYEKNYKLKRNFGITQAQYDDMFERQSGVCAICGKPQVRRRSLAVDHCHKNGQIRGLLCGSCNNGLGRFRDDPDLLRKAAQYLTD